MNHNTPAYGMGCLPAPQPDFSALDDHQLDQLQQFMLIVTCEGDLAVLREIVGERRRRYPNGRPRNEDE